MGCSRKGSQSPTEVIPAIWRGREGENVLGGGGDLLIISSKGEIRICSGMIHFVVCVIHFLGPPCP